MENNYKKIELPGRGYASFLVPELSENQELSVVGTDVLKKILQYLPKDTLSKVKRDFVCAVEGTLNIEDYLLIIKNELSFHSSVNMIESFFLDQDSKQVREPYEKQ